MLVSLPWIHTLEQPVRYTLRMSPEVIGKSNTSSSTMVCIADGSGLCGERMSREFGVEWHDLSLVKWDDTCIMYTVGVRKDD
jgi:hypothetical protein